MTLGSGRKLRLGTSIAMSVLALSFLAPGAAGETDELQQARFSLFTNCEPMDLVVGTLSADAEQIGLTMNSIQAAVESRLRSARLYNSNALTYIHVSINVVGGAFDVSLRYQKDIFDDYSQVYGYATTWSSGGVGTHGKNSGYILGILSQNTDEFLVEYLRANEEACEKR